MFVFPNPLLISITMKTPVEGGHKMIRLNKLNARPLSIAIFSFSFAYLLSFLFEGQVLYILMKKYGTNPDAYIITPIIGHFLGLLCCCLIVRNIKVAKKVMFWSMVICLVNTIPFFFAPSFF